MKRKIVIILFVLLIALSAPGQRRRSSGRTQAPPFGLPGTMCAPEDQICKDREAAQEKARNKQRQADLKKDTDKLFQLATELKDAVDKTNENILSIDVIKKTDEIEKLAKEIRKKMKNE
jgi:hypothetical protein